MIISTPLWVAYAIGLLCGVMGFWLTAFTLLVVIILLAQAWGIFKAFINVWDKR